MKLHHGDAANAVLIKMLEGQIAAGDLEKLVEGWGSFLPETGMDPLVVAHAAAATLLFAAERVAAGMQAQSTLMAGKPACPVCTAESVLAHVEVLRRNMVEKATAGMPSPDAPPNPQAN